MVAYSLRLGKAQAGMPRTRIAGRGIRRRASRNFLLKWPYFAS